MITPPTDDAHHILIVDDDKRIADLLARYLKQNGFRTSTANDAARARSAMEHLTFDLMILDVMMPGETGLEFARSLRETSSQKARYIPIIMLTALAETENRIEGLETGVDDYISKPFEPRELLLRVQSVLRRTREKPVTGGENIRFGNYYFHIGRGELKHNDETVKITDRERELLRLFSQSPGKPVPRHELSPDSTTTDRAIDVQVNRLRQKIEKDPKTPVYLQTVRGKGYILHID